jgi:hypothetical protein
MDELTVPPEMPAFSASSTSVVDAKFIPPTVCVSDCCVESGETCCCRTQPIKPMIRAIATKKIKNLKIFILAS